MRIITINLVLAALALLPVSALAADPASMPSEPRLEGASEASIPAGTEDTLAWAYVWGYTRAQLGAAIRIAHASGYRTVGCARYMYVPEAGGFAWAISVTPCY